ncbi:hypothetical protein D3C86_1831490 [compost metagenome]
MALYRGQIARSPEPGHGTPHYDRVGVEHPADDVGSYGGADVIHVDQNVQHPGEAGVGGHGAIIVHNRLVTKGVA